jgi:diguanylate cyclase (GGDEF)-like protein
MGVLKTLTSFNQAEGRCACQELDLWRSAVVSATGLIGIFSFADFFNAVVSHLATLMDSGGAALIVFDGPNHLRYRLFSGIEQINQQSIAAFRFRADSGTVGRALATGAPLYTEDYPNSPDAMPEFVQAGIKANLVIPLRDQSGLVGAMVISWLKPPPKQLEPSALMIVGMFAALVSAALYREALEDQLKAQSLHDPLTGLPNRRLLMRRLHEAHERARRHGGMVAVGVIDLDGFKQVNDEFGHSTGDEVLIAVASSFRSNMRTNDMIARLGGDEFVVILEDIKTVAEAEILFERLLGMVRDAGGTALEAGRIGASIGVAIDNPAASDPETLLKAADEAMYLSKRRGGNCVVFAGSAEGPPRARGLAAFR